MNLLSSILRAAPLSFLAVTAASAQSLNIDVGMNLAFFAGIPDAGYGAAGGQVGEWNGFMPTPAATGVFGLDGMPSGATLRSDASSTFNVFPGVMPVGDDQRLMEDFHLTPNLNTASTWTFEGLIEGSYVLYTYASDPSIASLQTEVRVLGSPDPDQTIGAGWPGVHGLGETYAMHSVTLSDPINTLVVQVLPVGSALETGVLNGFQLVREAGSGIGTPYCMANVNSSGAAATMFGRGSLLAADNDVELTCAGTPTFVFGFFLTSQTRAFTQNPGGSAGNLCVGGSVGRFVGPGQVQNSGALGEISLALDLTQLPQPNGFVSAQPGETWNFTAWFRDSDMGAPTSDFAEGYEITFQ